MDTKEMELKQEAAADLLQQGPHLEDADRGLPLFLQIRRDWLPASQRLDCKPRGPLEHSGEGSLEREGRRSGPGRQRPPGGAPSSRVKGTAEGDGGVKGPHSDSSTPSLEGQQPPKNPGTPSADWDIRKLTQFHLSLLGVSRVTDEETDWR
jgi:hypothetical protein